MNQQQSEAKIMLDQWGDFMRGKEDIGYSKINIIGRVMDEGPSASHGGIDPVIETPRDIQHVENVVLTMKPDIKKIIKYKFIYRLSQEESASYLNCARATVSARLEAGINYLAGTLYNFR